MEVDAKSILYMVAKHFGLKRNSTEDRLKLQKMVYLLQAYGMRLGYGFVWYKYGPYSKTLVSDAYAVLCSERILYEHGTKDWRFSPSTIEKLQQFRAEFGDFLNTADDLELLASVRFLLEEHHEKTDEDIARVFQKRKPTLFTGEKPSSQRVLEAIQTARKLE